MRAVVVREPGGPEVLTVDEVDEPVAAPGEVVVDVAAVDVIGLDIAIRAGAGEMFGITPPYTPGDGLAGTVTAAGEGVGESWRGRGVAVATGTRGAVAEQVPVPATSLVPVPDELHLEHAAALVHDGRTARALHDVARAAPGERVVIMPAASGLGLGAGAAGEIRRCGSARRRRGPAKLAVAAERGADACSTTPRRTGPMP